MGSLMRMNAKRRWTKEQTKSQSQSVSKRNASARERYRLTIDDVESVSIKSHPRMIISTISLRCGANHQRLEGTTGASMMTPEVVLRVLAANGRRRVKSSTNSCVNDQRNL